MSGGAFNRRPTMAPRTRFLTVRANLEEMR